MSETSQPDATPAGETNSAPAPAQPAAPANPEARIKEIMRLAHSVSPADRRVYEQQQDELDALIAARDGAGMPTSSPPAPFDQASEQRFKEIISLAHSSKPEDRRRYQELQPELHELAARKAGKQTTKPAEAPKPKPETPMAPGAPEVYELNWGEIAPNLSEADQKMWNTALADFRDAGFSQQQVDAVTAAFMRAQNAAQEAEGQAEEVRHTLAGRAGRQTEAELREAFGDDYDSRIEATNAFIRKGLSRYVPAADDRKALLNLRLEDGRRIGDLTPLVRWLSDLADENS